MRLCKVQITDEIKLIGSKELKNPMSKLLSGLLQTVLTYLNIPVKFKLLIKSRILKMKTLVG